jgi:hypothetical protein
MARKGEKGNRACRGVIGRSIPAAGSGGVVGGVRSALADGAAAARGTAGCLMGPDRSRFGLASPADLRRCVWQGCRGVDSRRSDRAGAGRREMPSVSWRSVGGPDGLGGGGFVNGLKVADVAKPVRVRFGGRRA